MGGRSSSSNVNRIKPFAFRTLPEGNSRADKSVRGNRLNMDILAIGERGTWQDLSTANGMIEDFYRRKMITKSDYERLNKASGTAERLLRSRRNK